MRHRVTGMDLRNQKRTKKRRRTVITPEEIERLEAEFRKEPKPDRNSKVELAKDLGKTENFINIWFQNRRAKERKMIKTPNETESSKQTQDLTVCKTKKILFIHRLPLSHTHTFFSKGI